MSKELQGKVALVTGSSSGIGKGIAISFAKEGANVVVNYNSNEQGAKSTAEEITKFGVQALVVKADVSKLSDIKFLFQETIKKFGKLDIFVNNSGFFFLKPLIEVTEEEYDKAFNINVKGAFFCLQEAAKVISNNGRIINISASATHMSGTANFSVYTATKGALIQFTKSLANELAPKKVTVNTLSPGATDTPSFVDAMRPKVIEATPLKRLGTIEDIGNVAAFLASPKAEWITGQNIHANGGFVTAT